MNVIEIDFRLEENKTNSNSEENVSFFFRSKAKDIVTNGHEINDVLTSMKRKETREENRSSCFVFFVDKRIDSVDKWKIHLENVFKAFSSRIMLNKGKSLVNISF